MDIGDQEATHSLVSCLELSIRRLISSTVQSQMSTSQSQLSLRITDSLRTEDDTGPFHSSTLSQSTSSLTHDDDDDEDEVSSISSTQESVENLSNSILEKSQLCLSCSESSISALEPTSMTEGIVSHAMWDGAILDPLLPAVIVHPEWEMATLRSWLRSLLRLQVGLLPWYINK